MSDIVERAEAALQGVTEGPWESVGYGNIHKLPVESAPPIGKVYGRANFEFVAWARTGVPELIAEIKRLRSDAGCCEQCGGGCSRDAPIGGFGGMYSGGSDV